MHRLAGLSPSSAQAGGRIPSQAHHHRSSSSSSSSSSRAVTDSDSRASVELCIRRMARRPPSPSQRRRCQLLPSLVMGLAALAVSSGSGSGSAFMRPFLRSSRRGRTSVSTPSSSFSSSVQPLPAVLDSRQGSPHPSSSRRSHLGSLLSVVTGAAVLGASPRATRAAGVDEYVVRHPRVLPRE